MEQVHALDDEDFRRLLGVKRATYRAMLAELGKRHAEHHCKRCSKLSFTHKSRGQAARRFGCPGAGTSPAT